MKIKPVWKAYQGNTKRDLYKSEQHDIELHLYMHHIKVYLLELHFLIYGVQTTEQTSCLTTGFSGFCNLLQPAQMS